MSREIATRTREEDLNELRLDRIAIEGQIDELGLILQKMERAKHDLESEIAKTARKLAEQKNRLRGRLRAIFEMESEDL